MAWKLGMLFYMHHSWKIRSMAIYGIVRDWIRILPSKHSLIPNPDTITKCARIMVSDLFRFGVRTLLLVAGSTPRGIYGYIIGFHAIV
jgi:hypothetical protein